jgi:chromosome segregation protein
LYLKTVKIVGFKSFADRTRLEFRPGVSVIVGPNGSGKSNLVDAVAWALGTQAPKALRTSKMEDVVFAGTTARPQLGRAEVTVVLDNADRAIGLDLPEVSITRRLYRDGSSDYEINGMACRLLDVQELLSDSGVGRHQHVIIGQGHVDDILNAGPDEHRAVIEEAAGILKHKLRREKAERRLERTDADVLRLKDIIGELTRQMRPLRRQAEAADRQRQAAEEVRAIGLYLGGEQLRRLDGRLGAAEEEEAALETDAREAETEASELGNLLRLVSEQAAVVGRHLDRTGAAAARLETTFERLRRIGQVAHERLRAARAALEGSEERSRDLASELEELTAQMTAAAAEEAEAATAAARSEQAFRSIEAEERLLADEEGLAPEGAAARLRGELAALEAARERDGNELDGLRARKAVLDAQLLAEREEIGRLDEEIRALDTDSSTAQRLFDEQATVRATEQEHWEGAEAAMAEARLHLAAAQGRHEALAAAVEGEEPAGRSLMESAPGMVGAIAARLDVPADLSLAVEAALGPFARAVVFAGADDLEQAMRMLKGDGRGGVAGVISRPGSAGPATELAAVTGLEPLVSRLGPAADLELGAALLGDVLLAEGWASGWDVVRRHPEVRAVTPEGDLVTAAGIRPGDPEGASPAALAAAGESVKAAEVDLARAESRVNSTRRAFESTRADERKALEALEALEARLAGASEALTRSRRAEAAIVSEAEILERRRAGLEEEMSRRLEQEAGLKPRLESLEGDEAAARQAWEDAAARRARLASAKEEARAAWQAEAGRAVAAAERHHLLEARRQIVEAGLGGSAATSVGPARLQRLEVVEETARQAAEVVKRHLAELRARQEAGRAEAAELEARSESLRARHHQRSAELAVGRERKAALALELVELRVRRESVAEGLRRDFDADEGTALAASAPEGEGDPADRLATRQAELRRMGAVNPLAAEEYAALAERHEFISSQMEDLEGSRRELRKVISALDDEIELRFNSAFEEIALAYQDLFTVLFPGGRGRLRVLDPDQGLASGVEIEAQPLGKKVSKLSLLSGGERSLAALAFLFAVFRARPSPFYVLDEVEAALDDSNLRRFLRLIEAFRREAQLVIVTHQQQTMEAADVLYGVTLEPGGSSQVVTKALAGVMAG